MLGALSFAFIDSINVLLIGVIVAVGVVASQAQRQYAKITALLIAGDWLGVASLAAVMLFVFDGLGPVVQTFVEGPIFGWLLIATGLLTAVLALRGGDNHALIERVMRPLRAPNALTVLTGFVLGIVQSATSVPFFGGLAVLSATGIDTTTKYSFLVLYATVALSLPTLCALLVGWVRAKPDSVAGRGFAWARSHPDTVGLTATWVVSLLLGVVGVAHLL